jgi:hypothetical protein
LIEGTRYHEDVVFDAYCVQKRNKEDDAKGYQNLYQKRDIFSAGVRVN